MSEDTSLDELRTLAESGDPEGQGELGFRYYMGFRGVDKDVNEAVRLFTLAAESGLARAQYNLAYCYQYGTGVGVNHSEGIRLYGLAAAQGFAPAQYNLAVCYENGEGVDVNHEAAVRLYRDAADQGHVMAQNNLGYCYKDGLGVERDVAEAVRLYTLAAEQGNAIAQYNLGDCYKNGLGVEANETEAIRWYHMSAKQGDGQAKKALENMGVHPKAAPLDEAHMERWIEESASKPRELCSDASTSPDGPLRVRLNFEVGDAGLPLIRDVFNDHSNPERPIRQAVSALPAPSFIEKRGDKAVADYMVDVLDQAEHALDQVFGGDEEGCVRGVPGMTRSKAAALYLYTCEEPNIYMGLNEALRNRQKIDRYKPYLRLLVDALRLLKAHQGSQDMTLFRGVDKNLLLAYPKVYSYDAQARKGSKPILWEAASCSLVPHTVESFLPSKTAGAGAAEEASSSRSTGCTVLQIRTTKGVDIHEFSAYESEGEWVLPPGTKIEITGKVDMGDAKVMLMCADPANPGPDAIR